MKNSFFSFLAKVHFLHRVKLHVLNNMHRMLNINVICAIFYQILSDLLFV